MSSTGNQRLPLDTRDKLKAIDRVNAGESKAGVARSINVAESTLRGWCKSETKLRALFVAPGPSGAKLRPLGQTNSNAVSAVSPGQQVSRPNAGASGSGLNAGSSESGHNVTASVARHNPVLAGPFANALAAVSAAMAHLQHQQQLQQQQQIQQNHQLQIAVAQPHGSLRLSPNGATPRCRSNAGFKRHSPYSGTVRPIPFDRLSSSTTSPLPVGSTAPLLSSTPSPNFDASTVWSWLQAQHASLNAMNAAGIPTQQQPIAQQQQMRSVANSPPTISPAAQEQLPTCPTVAEAVPACDASASARQSAAPASPPPSAMPDRGDVNVNVNVNINMKPAQTDVASVAPVSPSVDPVDPSVDPVAPVDEPMDLSLSSNSSGSKLQNDPDVAAAATSVAVQTTAAIVAAAPQQQPHLSSASGCVDSNNNSIDGRLSNGSSDSVLSRSPIEGLAQFIEWAENVRHPTVTVTATQMSVMRHVLRAYTESTVLVRGAE